MVLTAIFQRLREQGRSRREPLYPLRCAYLLTDRTLRQSFTVEATTDGSMLAKLVQCLLVINQYAVAVVTFAGLQQLSQSLVICGVMALKHIATPNASLERK